MSTIAQYLTQRRSYLTDKYHAKAEILDVNENVVEEITTDVLDGSISVTLQNGSRRSASLTLNNKSRRYTLSPTGLLWLDTKFRLSTGIEINGVVTWWSQGVFILGECNEGSTNSSSTVNLQLYDKFSLLDGTISGLLTNALIVPLGTNVNTAIASILSSANTTQPLLAYTVKPLIATPNTFQLPYTLRIDENSSYYDALNTLAEALSQEIYFNQDGYPILALPTDFTTEPTTFAFTDADKLKLSLNKKVDISKLKNYVRVVGMTANTGVIYDATAEDTNVTSPTRTSLIGRRELYIQDSVINTQPLADLRSAYELSKAIQATEAIAIEAIPLDFIQEGMIVGLIDERLQILTSERYLIRQFTMPFLHNGATMPLDVWRTRSFS